MATETNTPTIQKIVTHSNPHIDEIAGVWLLRRFGSEHFQGIMGAPLEFWSEGSASLQKTAEEYLAEGILLVGIGGGMFDEHPTADTKRKEGKCAATLIAEHLGIDDDPTLEHILNFVRRNDLNGTGSMFDIASICRRMYHFMPAEKVITWATFALEVVYLEQTKFAQEAAKEYQKGKVLDVRNSGRVIRVMVVESDNEMVAKFAQSARGGNAAVVIQKRSTGNVQIFANRKIRVNMDKIARFIRLAEQKVKKRIITLRPSDLERDGTVLGAEEWHFFKKGQGLFNGSISHPDVPPTNLPLEEITRIVCGCVFM